MRKQSKDRHRQPEEEEEEEENQREHVSASSGSGNEENEVRVDTVPVTDVPVKKKRGRPPKYGMTAAAKVIKRATKNGAVKVTGVNEPVRRPGRPCKKKPENESRKSQLEMLHEQTILSINNRTGKRLSPAPGCVDSKLSSPDDATDGLPSVIITDSSDLSVGEKLDHIMSAWKQDMQNFLSYMQ